MNFVSYGSAYADSMWAAVKRIGFPGRKLANLRMCYVELEQLAFANKITRLHCCGLPRTFDGSRKFFIFKLAWMSLVQFS